MELQSTVLNKIHTHLYTCKIHDKPIWVALLWDWTYSNGPYIEYLTVLEPARSKVLYVQKQVSMMRNRTRTANWVVAFYYQLLSALNVSLLHLVFSSYVFPIIVLQTDCFVSKVMNTLTKQKDIYHVLIDNADAC